MNQNPNNNEKRKQTLLALAVFAAVCSFSSCAKCVVCVDKGGDEYAKMEFCDKDFDKEDIDDAIEFYEDQGMNCHRKQRALL